MSDYELTESERFTRAAEWDKFSLEHRGDFQSTFARTVAREAFDAAFEAGIRCERERWESTGR